MKGYLSLIAAFVFIIIFKSGLIAEPKGLDMDGDGFSEVIGVEVQNDGSANEIAFTWLETSSGLIKKREFGKSSESYVAADYDGDGITDLAVVGPDSLNKLQWRFIHSTSGEISNGSQFGVLGDRILSGCDFDGDRRVDRIAITREGQFIMEQSSDSSIFVHADNMASYERFTCGDISGDGIADLIGQKNISTTSKRKKRDSISSSSISQFVIWDIYNNQKLVEENFGKDVKSIFAADVNGDGIDEYGYERKVSRKSSDLVFNIGGAPFVVRTPSFKGISITNFNGSSDGADGFVIKLDSANKFMRYRSFQVLAAKEQVTLSKTDNILPGVRFITPGPVQSTESECSVHYDPTDGVNGFLWKPTSDTTRNAVLLLPAGIRLKNVRIIKNGIVLENLRYSGNGNGGRDHWRSSRRSSSFDDLITVVGTRAGVNHCWLIEDPDQRID